MKRLKGMIAVAAALVLALTGIPTAGFEGVLEIWAEGEGPDSLYIKEDGYAYNGDTKLPDEVYYKVDGAAFSPGSAADYNIAYNATNHLLKLKNFRYSYDGVPICSDYDGHIDVEVFGANEIFSQTGSAMTFCGSTYFLDEGNGSLVLSTDSYDDPALAIYEAAQNSKSAEDGYVVEQYEKKWLKVKNEISITCKSNGEFDATLDGTRCCAISNKGYVYGRIRIYDIEGYCTNLEPYTTKRTDTTSHDYFGKAYYFGSYDHNYSVLENARKDLPVVEEYIKSGVPSDGEKLNALYEIFDRYYDIHRINPREDGFEVKNEHLQTLKTAIETTYNNWTLHTYLQEQYPMNILGEFSNSGEWRVIADDVSRYYDADGWPKASYNFWQYIFTNESGAVETEDFNYPCSHLFDYTDAQFSRILTPNDVVSYNDRALGAKGVANGGTIVGGEVHHEITTDEIYYAWINDANLVFNGNITLDMSVFSTYIREAEDENSHVKYGRDQNGRIVHYPADMSKASITINGNVGFTSLHKSFAGNVTVNGNADCFGYYDDVEEAEDYAEMPMRIYGAAVSPKQLIVNGKFDTSIKPLEGFVGMNVYFDEGDNLFYSMTEKERDGDYVHGTTAAIDDNALAVDVSAGENLPEDTFPCVKASDDDVVSAIKNHLTNASSKVLAMDIRLITGNESESEPSASVNLYIDDLSGFTNPAVFHIRDNGTYEKLGVATEATSVTVSTDQFSTYFIAEDQNLKSSGGSGGITLSSAPAVGTAVSDASSKGKFVVSGDHTVKYTGTTSKGKTVTIPDTITINGETYRVTAIKKNALKGNSKVTTVKIGKNVKVIGVAAFANCKNLKEVTIGAGTTTICKNTFKNCKKLSSVKLYGNNLKKVGKNAFSGVSKNIKITVLAKNKTTYKKAVKLLKSAGTEAEYAYKKSSKK